MDNLQERDFRRAQISPLEKSSDDARNMPQKNRYRAKMSGHKKSPLILAFALINGHLCKGSVFNPARILTQSCDRWVNQKPP
jgi:hypothetical protein